MMLESSSDLIIIALNICAYVIGAMVIKFTKVKFLNALIIAIVLVVAGMNLCNIDYETYKQGSRFISFLLGPSVVALGYMLHKQISVIRRTLFPIMISIFVGAVVNIVIINLVLTLFGVDTTVIYSIQPKSVTTAIAISLSEHSEGIISLTAMSTVVTGILGSLIGPTLLKWCGITSPVAKGLAMGASAHGIGTARALEMGVKEGAISGLAIGLMGVATSLMILVLKNFLL